MAKEVRFVGCPRCGAPGRHAAPVTGHLVGSRFWSDGKLQAAMWEPEVEVTRCPACRAYFWIRDAPELRERPKRRVRVPWLRQPPAEGLVEAAASGAARDTAEEVRLRQLVWWELNDPLREPWQLHVGCCGIVGVLVAWPLVRYFPGDWWLDKLVLAFLAANLLVLVVTALVQLGEWWRDARRRRLAVSDPEGLFQRNLRALVDLLEPARPEQRVLKAEALRELGRCEEALELLRDPVPGHLQRWAEGVRRLAEARDVFARPIEVQARAGR